MIGLALTRRRLALSAVSAVAALATSLGLFAPAAAHAATTMPRVPASCSSYIVGSTYLTNDDTGITKPSYGQVQLWYSSCDGTKWTEVISGFGNVPAHAEIDRNDGVYEFNYCPSAKTCLSDHLYSPGVPAAAYGWIWFGGTYYEGYWTQPGYTGPGPHF